MPALQGNIRSMNSAVLASTDALVETFSLHFVRYPDGEVSPCIIRLILVVCGPYWSSELDIIVLRSMAPDQNIHC
jgi:hypothetical protein